MAFVVNFVKTIRNNWKKSIFFTTLAYWGTNYGRRKYDESVMRKIYCEEAKKYGDELIKSTARSRKITVFMNPAASGGKGKSLFDKNVAPLLHLAGLEVSVVRTEHQGQAKQFVGVVERNDTDGILAAGGDGTVNEVITGMLRREDEGQFSKVPIGVLPVGKTNTLSQVLFFKGGSDVRAMLEAGISVVRGFTRPMDVMCIKGDEGKTVYSIAGLDWGVMKEAELRKKKYWYFGKLKDKWTYIWTAARYWPEELQADLTYVKPCDGCSKCYIPPPVPQWRWWHFFLPPKQVSPPIDYSKIENEDCGIEHSTSVKALQISCHTNNLKENVQGPKHLKVRAGPEKVSRSEFIKEGWARERGEKTESQYQEIFVQDLQLTPKVQLQENEEAWFLIDNEQFELMPVSIKLLKDKLHVFCGNKHEPTVRCETIDNRQQAASVS